MESYHPGILPELVGGQPSSLLRDSGEDFGGTHEAATLWVSSSNSRKHYVVSRMLGSLHSM